MSYDLYFYVENENERISNIEFKEYFRSRKNFIINDDGNAIYGNVDTGVYFYFEYSSENSAFENFSDEDNTEDNIRQSGFKFCGVSFNINLLRPHAFCMEASQEINRFVENYKLHVLDYQASDGSVKRFDIKDFETTWITSNDSAFEAIHKTNPEGGRFSVDHSNYMTKEDVERSWKWNYRLPDLQGSFGEEIYVARIMYMKELDRVMTFVVWPDCIPIAIPKVDKVVVQLSDYAKSKLFSKKDTISVIDIKKLDEIKVFSKVSDSNTDGIFMLFEHDDIPKEIITFCQRQKTQQQKPSVIAFESIYSVNNLKSGNCY